MKTEQELTQLAIDVLQNVVYMAQDEEAVMCSFQSILWLLDEKALGEIQESKPSVFYEQWDKSLGSHNGYPMFLSVKWLTEEEWKIFYPIYQAKKEALEKI